MDCSLSGSFLHGILQARILEWVAISFSRGSSWHRDQTQVSHIAGRDFNLWATSETQSQVKPKTKYTQIKKKVDICIYARDFPAVSDGKECRRPRFDPWIGNISWRRICHPTAVFLPGEFHGQRSLVGYNPWGHKESDVTEWLKHTHIHVYV